MESRPQDCFFYGLFMDAEMLHEAGTQPSNFRRAYVDDFALCIGERATLVPSPGARAYGMLISLTHAELDRLYGEPGLEAYRAEAVIAHPVEGEATAALCFNLDRAPAPQERNPDYATRLKQILGKLGFPAAYIASIK